MQKLEEFSFALLLPHARESGFQNLGNFLLVENTPQGVRNLINVGNSEFRFH